MALITYDNANTSININGHLVNNLVQGDFLTIELPNEVTARENSTDDGVAIMPKVDREVGIVTIKVQRYTPSDVFLRGIGAGVVNGTIATEYARDGGDKLAETWTLNNGSQAKAPTLQYNNQDATAFDVEYTFEFRTATRGL